VGCEVLGVGGYVYVLFCVLLEIILCV